MALLVPVAWIVLGMTVPLSGTVKDADGRPVAGATVWLGDTIATWKGPEVLATAETDEAGRFRLERPADIGPGKPRHGCSIILANSKCSFYLARGKKLDIA